MATKKPSSKSLLSKAKKLSESFAKNQNNMSKPTPNTVDSKGKSYYSPPPVLPKVSMSKPTPNTMDSKGTSYYSPPPTFKSSSSVPSSKLASNVGVAGKGYWDTKGWVSGTPDANYLKQSGSTLSGLGFSNSDAVDTRSNLAETPIKDFYDPTLDEGYDSYQDLTQKDEDKIRRDVLQRYQGQINATKASYSRLLGDTQLQGTGRLGEQTAMQARGGLMGSDFGAAMTDKTRAYNRGEEENVLESQANSISAIMAQAESDARNDIAARRSAKQYGYESLKEYNAAEATRKQANIKKVALAMLRQSVDPQTMGAQLKDLAKKYKVSENDIINSYLEEEKLQSQAEAEAEAAGAFNLSEGQARYDSKGNLIASRAKTYQPKDGGGSYYGPGSEENAVAKDWATAIVEGRAKLSDIPASEKGLRTAVAAELANPQMSQAKRLELDNNIQIIDDIIANDAYKSITGIGQFFPSITSAKAYNKYNQLKGLLTLNGRQKLKGSGAISDFEVKMLEKAESSLGRNLSNEDFKEILDEVRATFLAARDRAAASEAQAPTMMSETDVMDPEIQELLDQGYTEEQIQELINA